MGESEGIHAPDYEHRIAEKEREREKNTHTQKGKGIGLTERLNENELRSHKGFRALFACSNGRSRRRTWSERYVE